MLSMPPLSPDPSFHYEFLRVLAAAVTQGSDVAELLHICPKIRPGDFESWYAEFHQLAQSVLQSIDPAKSYDNVALRNAYFRASHYFFAADFYLHADAEDPRIDEMYQQWSTLFDKATALLPVPGERHHLQADGFKVPIVVLRPDASAQPKPTLILGNGFDGALEEMYHVLGVPALERGYNVVLYEGPGQTGVRRTQNVGFIHNWEAVVTPVIDHLVNLDFVDAQRITLLGYSMGGYLAARAAAFEHRLAACVLLDGVWEVSSTIETAFPQAMELYHKGDAAGCNQALEEHSQQSTGKRWLHEHLLWSFMSSGYEAIQELKKMTMAKIIHQIQCPVFVGEALDDQFFQGHGEKYMQAIPDRAHLFCPGQEFAATTHCHVGATLYLAQELFAWLSDKQLASTGR